MNNLKRILCLVCALAAVLWMAGCGRLKITDEEALEILNDLIPKAAVINDIFFGAGLPVGGEVPESDNSEALYIPVSPDSPYQSVKAIKDAAEQVYSSGYLSSVYVSMFEGTSANGEDDAAVATISPRYKEIGGELRINVSFPSYSIRRIESVRSAHITGNARKRVTVACSCIIQGSDRETELVLYLTQENGRWLLHSPSY